MWIAIIVLFVTLIAMACCEGVRRSFPTNFIFLGLFTLAQTFMLGTLTARVPADTVSIMFNGNGSIQFRHKMNSRKSFWIQTGFACCWCHRGRLSWFNALCIPNQMGFHRLQWHTLRGHNYFHDIRIGCDVLPWQNYAIGLRIMRRIPVQHLPDL